MTSSPQWDHSCHSRRHTTVPPHYITKTFCNHRHFHYKSDRETELGERLGSGWWGPLVARGCWEWAFRPHLLFIVNFLPRNHPKMQTDCRKIKQKINWPRVTRMRAFAVPGWSALMFSLIYWACIAEPAAWAQTHASHNEKQRDGEQERE